MDIQYVPATPELKARMRAQSESNASDFIRFEDNYCSLIAMDGDRPVALIVAKRRPLSEPLQMVQEAYIDIIEVQPEYRRRGIGTICVEKVEAWAREHQVAQIRAWSEEIRVEALMLWKKLGYSFARVDFQRGDEKRYGFYVVKALYL
jgi:GNAT superfamily N-acetyltransferase